MSVKIRVKNGKLILDIHYGEGRRTRPSTGLEDTEDNRKTLVHDVIPDIERQIAKGTYLPKAERVAVVKTVKDYGELSFKRHVNERRKHVQQSYKNHFIKHIVPKFGKKLITSVTSMQLLDWQNEKLENYTVSTVKKYRSIFYTILNDAVVEGIIDINPFNRVPSPVVIEEYNEDDDLDEEDKHVDPFTLDELQHILSRVNNYKKNFFGIMAFSGIRPGELVALKWSDIDFESETFKVLRTRVRSEFGPTKTISSKRTVEMIGNVKEYFLSQYNITGGNIFDMVFLNSSSKPFYSHDTIAKQFKELLDDKDKRYLYQLRHTFASLMLTNDEDIAWVSQMMGHKNPDITLKVYASAYRLAKDKKLRKKRANFLDNWHKSGTANNPMFDKPHEIGVSR
jgi:integrase